jgi:hypothetical protein
MSKNNFGEPRALARGQHFQWHQGGRVIHRQPHGRRSPGYRGMRKLFAGQRLLHRHAFRKIAGHVDVAAAADGNVIGQQL